MQVSKESIEAEDQPQINPDPSNETNEEDSGLAQFLIDRACKNSVIANYFYWYLMVEVDDQNENAIMQDTAKDRQMYKSVLQRFTNALKSGPQVSSLNEIFALITIKKKIRQIKYLVTSFVKRCFHEIFAKMMIIFIFRNIGTVTIS